MPFLPAQPPLNLFGLPARYASALYTAASKAGNIPVVQAEFKTLIDAANGDPKFKTFLEDPTMSKAKKIAGLTAFCDGAGFAPVTKSFLCVVAENGRLAENQKIYDALEEYTLAAAGQDPANAGTTIQVCMDVAGVVITCVVCSFVFEYFGGVAELGSTVVGVATGLS